MSSPDVSSSFHLVQQPHSAGLTVQVHGALDSGTSQTALNEFAELPVQAASGRLVLDLARLDRIDDYGVAVLACVKGKTIRAGGAFDFAHVSPQVRSILDFHHFESLCQPPLLAVQKRLDIFSRIGNRVLLLLRGYVDVLTFLGATALAFGKAVANPRRALRGQDLVEALQTTGVDALPIVALISFLLGLIMAFMSAVQLEQFGANVYVASLVSLSMTRELGPIMTCILVAGRSGSAYASEIGSMQISEEIDALKTMGFDPHLFLVVPRIIAAVLVVPVLTLFSDLFAIAGGLLIGVSMLDLTVHSYLSKTVETLDPFDVLWGIGKSALFALLIAWVGCFKGFGVRGGPAAVGRATTSAVVTSIFLIILTDSLFAVILRYWE